MNTVLISLIPYIIGSALVPIQIIVVILLLTSERRGPLKAILFVLGMTLARIAQGILFGLALTGDGDSADAAQSSGGFRALLLIGLGILLLLTAYKQWAREPDPDAPPPKWLTMLDDVTLLRALLFGAGFILIAAKLWIFTLSAISTIGAAQLGRSASTTTYLLYILLAQALLILPILLRLLLPNQAGGWLRAFGGWLEKNNRPIVIVVSLVFGLFFLYQGLSKFF